MKAAEVMTTDVVTIGLESTIAEAVQVLIGRRISGLPVLDQAGDLVGMLTEGDLLRRAETGTEVKRPRWLEFLVGPGRLAKDYAHAHARKVADVMSSDVVSADADANLEDVVALMQRHAIKRVPIRRERRLVGIITRADLVRALGRALQQGAALVGDDEAIRSRIIADIAKQPWAPSFGISVIVRDGTVHLCGVVTTDELRYALKVLAESVPGVRDVKDHLTFVEPISGMFVGAPDGPPPDEIGSRTAAVSPTAAPGTAVSP